jgi:hypothetical protein
MAQAEGRGFFERLIGALGGGQAPLVKVEPRFQQAGVARAPRDGAREVVREVRRTSMGDAFTPTRPRQGRRMIGRQKELERILRAILEEQAHVVLYSERGRGKTSLCNLVVESLRRAGVIVARHTCEAGTSFDSLLRGLARDLPVALLATSVSAVEGTEGCEAALPLTNLRPRDVVALPSRLTCRGLVCVVDEFDRIEDAGARTLLADSIKQLSDQGIPLAFMIVGVSENLEQILGQHPSIQRALVSVNLPLLPDADIADLILRGAYDMGLQVQPSVVTRVTEQARGMPYVAQLMGLRLAQCATSSGSINASGQPVIGDTEFDIVVQRMIEETPPRVLALHAAMTSNGRDAEMESVLHRIATARQDHWGRLQIAGTADGGLVIEGMRVSPGCWQRLDAAGLLQPSDAGPGHVTFGQRGLMHYVLLLAARDGLQLTPEPDIETTRAHAALRTPYVVSGS